jgi:4-hydroxy-3-polyprenylbenzoate decarboxylase
MVSMAEPSRSIVGIPGASGVTYGVRLPRGQRKIPVESHLVMTRTAEVTLAHESRMTDLAAATQPRA